MSDTATAVGAPAWTIADRLRKAREIHGWKQADLARASDGDLTVRTISNYESEDYASERQRKTLRRWAMVCGVPLDWLEFGTVPTDDDGVREQGEVSTGWFADEHEAEIFKFPSRIAA